MLCHFYNHISGLFFVRFQLPISWLKMYNAHVHCRLPCCFISGRQRAVSYMLWKVWVNLAVCFCGVINKCQTRNLHDLLCLLSKIESNFIIIIDSMKLQRKPSKTLTPPPPPPLKKEKQFQDPWLITCKEL